MNVLKKAGHVEGGEALDKLIKIGNPWVVKAKKYVKMAEGMIRSAKPKAKAKSKASVA